MQTTFCIVLVIYSIYLFFIAIMSSKRVSCVRDYFSYLPEHDEHHVIKTFQATNASFMTAFLSLFIYTSFLGWATLWIPIGFCIGILFYSKLILPKQSKYLFYNLRYPYLLSEMTGGGGLIRVLSSLFIIISMWLFLFVEVQGFIRFCRAFFEGHPGLVWILPLLIVLGMLSYVYAGGFQTVVLTDKIQMKLISMGTVSLLILILLLGLKNNTSFGLSTISYDSLFMSWSFIIQTIVGFAFAQLLYYENWVRLSLFLGDKSRNISSQEAEGIIFRFQNYFNTSSLILFLVYCLPIIGGMASMQCIGGAADEFSMVAFFSQLWKSHWSAPLFMVFVFLQLISALLSTADTYVISATTTVYEDILSKNLSSNEAGVSLKMIKLISAVFVISMLPMVFTKWDFTLAFSYLFY